MAAQSPEKFGEEREDRREQKTRWERQEGAVFFHLSSAGSGKTRSGKRERQEGAAVRRTAMHFLKACSQYSNSIPQAA